MCQQRFALRFVDMPKLVPVQQYGIMALPPYALGLTTSTSRLLYRSTVSRDNVPFRGPYSLPVREIGNVNGLKSGTPRAVLGEKDNLVQITTPTHFKARY